MTVFRRSTATPNSSGTCVIQRICTASAAIVSFVKSAAAQGRARMRLTGIFLPKIRAVPISPGPEGRKNRIYNAPKRLFSNRYGCRPARTGTTGLFTEFKERNCRQAICAAVKPRGPEGQVDLFLYTGRHRQTGNSHYQIMFRCI